jgi:uncharacterized membrane protein
MSDTPLTAEESPMPSAAEKVRLSWPQQVLGVIGFAVSLYAYRAHLQIKAGGSACGFTDYISCDKVLGSKYGEFFHIPLGVYGMVFFAIVVITSIDTDLNPMAVRRSAGIRLIVATFGVLTSLALEYISVALIKAACPICLATHAVSLLNFIYSLYDYLKLRRNTAILDRPSNTNPTN